MNPNKQYRKHRFEDYEPDESNANWDKVKIIPKLSTSDNGYIGYIGYMSRYDSKRFRFEEIGVEQEILNYKDWNIEYV